MQPSTMVLGDDQGMSLSGGLNIEERVGVLGLDQFEGGDLSLDDLAEDTGSVVCGS